MELKKKLREIRNKIVKVYDIEYKNKTFTYLTVDEDRGIVSLHDNGVLIKNLDKTYKDTLQNILEKLI